MCAWLQLTRPLDFLPDALRDRLDRSVVALFSYDVLER